MRRLQARSSGGERYLDTVEVGGSKPPAPTTRYEETRRLFMGIINNLNFVVPFLNKTKK